MIIPRYKCIFVRVPKTASTSMIKAMGCTTDNRLNTKLVWDGDTNHYPLSVMKKIISPSVYENYFKWGFVRNPWDKVVSIYFWHKKNKGVNAPTFEEFVYRIPNSVSDWFKMTDSQFTKGCDFVGRYETIKEDWDYLCSLLGVNWILPFCNKSEHEHYSTYYNKKTEDVVRQHYKDDIETFGYEFGE